MADTDRRSFPKIPAKNWFDLRRRLNQALPPSISVDYLQSVLGLEAPSARNLLSPLRAIGLIDEAERLTDLGLEWRTDEGYADACRQMLQKVYPEDLLAAFPGPNPDREGLTRWFMRNARVGEGAGKQLAAFYLLLATPNLDVDSPEGSASRPRGDAPARQPRTPRASAPRSERQPDRRDTQPPDGAKLQRSANPTIHIDVQVHIDPSASADQIDQIFASMARHLYRHD